MDVGLIPDSVRERDLVGYGRNPPQFAWPEQALVVVNVVLVYEEGSEYSVRWGDDRNDGWGERTGAAIDAPDLDLGTESHFEYGSRAGIWRLARIVDEATIPVTVSATAAALELNPAVAGWMNERGHDLLGHGWRWIEPWRLSRDEEYQQLLQAIDSYERVSGSRPLGWNCRSVPSPHTRELLVQEEGFLYDSDSSADDVPFYARTSRGPFLVIPYSKTYNDSRYLISPGFASPRDFLETLTFGLDQLVRERRTAMMTVCLHARWSGQAARAAALSAFVDHARGLQDVVFMRRLDIARWWLDRYPAPEEESARSGPAKAHNGPRNAAPSQAGKDGTRPLQSDEVL
jgi:peptidoglycan/xylan/chitin deacetylase (PgdA/CDA1 family)